MGSLKSILENWDKYDSPKGEIISTPYELTNYHELTPPASVADPPASDILETRQADPAEDVDESAAVERGIAWVAWRASQIYRQDQVALPEAQRRAWLELRARLDGQPPSPYDRLVGPRRTTQGTLVWSDPAEPPLELFGPPPGETTP